MDDVCSLDWPAKTPDAILHAFDNPRNSHVLVCIPETLLAVLLVAAQKAIYFLLLGSAHTICNGLQPHNIARSWVKKKLEFFALRMEKPMACTDTYASVMHWYLLLLQRPLQKLLGHSPADVKHPLARINRHFCIGLTVAVQKQQSLGTMTDPTYTLLVHYT